MLNYKVFLIGMVQLSEIFKKGENLSKTFLQNYYQAIEDLTDTQFERGVKYLIKNHQSHFFPIPSELKKAVLDSQETATLTPEDKRIEPNYIPCPDAIKQQIREMLNKKGLS